MRCWRITTTIIEERQRREIQPVHRALNAVASDLRGANFSSANLMRAELSHASFANADLSGANMETVIVADPPQRLLDLPGEQRPVEPVLGGPVLA